jgi:hypothetical protein
MQAPVVRIENAAGYPQFIETARAAIGMLEHEGRWPVARSLSRATCCGGLMIKRGRVARAASPPELTAGLSHLPSNAGNSGLSLRPTGAGSEREFLSSPTVPQRADGEKLGTRGASPKSSIAFLARSDRRIGGRNTSIAVCT